MSIAANVLERAVPFFPKRPEDCKVICIPTAATPEKEPKAWLYKEMDEFRRIGFNLTMLDIDGKTQDEVAASMEDADIVYVTGGNTFFLLEKMRACGFESIIRNALERGAVYIGCSAGTVVCCPDIDYVRTMDDPGVAELGDTIGLNLIDFFVMVHMDHASYAEKANDKVIKMKHGPVPVICLKDDQALFIDGQSISIV